MDLDDISWLILDELQSNGRISYKELGERVGLTPPAVADRVRKLERAGVITGYTAIIDPDALGLPILAVIRIRTRGDSVGTVDELVHDLPEVVECHRVTGSENHVIRAVLQSTGHLEQLLDRLMPYGETITNIVTSSPVARRALSRELVR